ncbi:hypothetical protein GCM10007860_25780 [Chitiniphilus shinanonensis]|uniref:ATP-dependent Clp protease proteolytic subunit n=1 Tax=Chitiniphilus shinanonensis TaxID=553088 RepID=A0ABQ6BTV0_9NEIS|nr:hypothetical protein [Chitiniphilus shinanonensis]GLS05425.1 hypothetical protein GCM10007860_25780 [Chitiniphilus shinanonensis]
MVDKNSYEKNLLNSVYGRQLRAASLKGKLTSLSPGILKVEGILDYDLMQNLVGKNDVTEIVINSGGGDVVYAIKIAEWMREKKVKLSVDGVCISSCANYMAVAAAELKVNGLVIFHGNMMGYYYQCKLSQAQYDACDFNGLYDSVKAEIEFYKNYPTALKLAFASSFFGERGRDENAGVFLDKQALASCGYAITSLTGGREMYSWMEKMRIRWGRKFYFDNWSKTSKDICEGWVDRRIELVTDAMASVKK